MANEQLLTVEEIAGVRVVAFKHPHQSVDELMIPSVNEELLSKTESAQNVIMNMQNVDFFGSAFIESMFRVWKRMKSKDGGFAVYGLQPHCREVLEVTNLIGLWGGYNTQEDALAAMNAD